MFEQLDQKVSNRHLWWKLLAAAAFLFAVLALLVFAPKAKSQNLPPKQSLGLLVAPKLPKGRSGQPADNRPSIPSVPPTDKNPRVFQAPPKVPNQVDERPESQDSNDQNQTPCNGLGCVPGQRVGDANDPDQRLGSFDPTALKPPVPKIPDKQQPPQQIRVGGRVQAANLINKVTPEYPALAKQAHIQGLVTFTAVIGRDGSIQNLVFVSGHPMLAEVARQAVSRWRYRPTLLNGEPVEVITQITVSFTLAQ